VFYVASLILMFLIGSFVKPFIRSYSEEKAKNLATKEDIRELTVTVEGIKAEISDQMWDRQKQWELRRDAVLDGVRAHADLESALVNLNSCLSGYLSVSEKGLTDKTDAEVKATIQDSRKSRASYWSARQIAALAVGGQFSNAMSAYFHLTSTVIKDMTRQKSFLDSAKCKELELSSNNVILSAREALGIKDAGDLPRFDDSN
ncbi:MAG: hypothetical protein ABSG51_11490, partial [Terracidiphilus sp.]